MPHSSCKRICQRRNLLFKIIGVAAGNIGIEVQHPEAVQNGRRRLGVGDQVGDRVASFDSVMEDASVRDVATCHAGHGSKPRFDAVVNSMALLLMDFDDRTRAAAHQARSTGFIAIVTAQAATASPMIVFR